ncbi:MAG: DNA-binding protein WhiA [Clostridia bacterium]|nr:DNA-binding protein WhiA [Clostridia bacterium]
MEQRKQLSFSWMVKSELMQELPKSKKEIIAELIVFMGVCGSLSLGNGIVFEVDKPSYAKRLYSHIKAIYGVSPKIHMKRFNRLGKSYKYIIRITEPEICQSILKDTGYINKAGEFNLNHGIKKSAAKTLKERQSILKSAFLLCGSISSPEKHYHMEMVFADLKLAEDIAELIIASGLSAKTMERKSARVVYIKGSDGIVSFLALIGATSSTLEFYNIKIIKETRNNVNRVVNCETANIGKTINAAARQLESINIIKEKQGLNSLPQDLYEAAELRLSNPDMSLNDMAQMCTPIISKSGLNHRFKRIDKIARDLK